MSSDDDLRARAFERRRTHCSRDSRGRLYPGQVYLRVLQCMKGDEAEMLAHKVEPFFWSDADMIHVRLCDDCASRLRIDESLILPAASVKSFYKTA